MPGGSPDERFDGTMRVGFALRRRSDVENDFAVSWLGGYWKLPVRVTSETRCDNIDELRDKLVSFSTQKKRELPRWQRSTYMRFSARWPLCCLWFSTRKDVLQRRLPRDTKRTRFFARSYSPGKVSLCEVLGLVPGQRSCWRALGKWLWTLPAAEF